MNKFCCFSFVLIISACSNGFDKGEGILTHVVDTGKKLDLMFLIYHESDISIESRNDALRRDIDIYGIEEQAFGNKKWKSVKSDYIGKTLIDLENNYLAVCRESAYDKSWSCRFSVIYNSFVFHFRIGEEDFEHLDYIKDTYIYSEYFESKLNDRLREIEKEIRTVKKGHPQLSTE